MNEKSKFIKESDTAEKIIQYEDIADELPRIGRIRHYDYPNSYRNVVKKMRGGAITEEEANILFNAESNLGGRGKAHILRMAQRPGAEKNFALACCENFLDMFKENFELQSRITHVVGGEGCDPKMFWTFAPYIFKALKEKDLDEKEAMRFVLEWGGTGKRTMDKEKNDPVLNLKGLEFLNGRSDGFFILDENPNHISHKFVEQEAKRIADMLIEDETKK